MLIVNDLHNMSPKKPDTAPEPVTETAFISSAPSLAIAAAPRNGRSAGAAEHSVRRPSGRIRLFIVTLRPRVRLEGGCGGRPFPRDAIVHNRTVI
jgi:hypothetical protein